MSELNKAAILEWVEALESGEYQQTTGTLARYVQGLPSPVSYCCLGVACDVFKNRIGLGVEDVTEGTMRFLAFDGNSEGLPFRVRDFLGLASGDPVVVFDERPYTLSSLNDLHDRTFPEIAAILRANYLKEETNG